MFFINGDEIPLPVLNRLSQSVEPVQFSEFAEARINAARAVVDEIVASGETVYGVNTGFGRLSDVRIADSELGKLQTNLVRSHACGFGEPLAAEEVRALILLRANVFARGNSGIRLSTAKALLALYQNDVLPRVPRYGSVGASGDLAPLAHLSLVVLGEGSVLDPELTSQEALHLAKLAPVDLAAKEGLALLNGTQAMLSVGGLALEQAMRLVGLATLGSCLSLEGLLGTPTAYDARIHTSRNQAGQIRVAGAQRTWLEGSEIRESHRHHDTRVQDAYSLRCIPQVHGAALDVLRYATEVLQRETAASTDNPLVFADESEMISGGNFHGAPIAVAMDAACIGLVHMLSMVERRMDRLINPDANEGLPAFLAGDPGLESGHMMLHVSVAAALNEARILAHPSSADNTPTSGGKEDHVSMGMTGANKLKRITELVAFSVAAEWMSAVQALQFRKPLRTSLPLQAVLTGVEELIPINVSDRVLGPDTETLARALLQGRFDAHLTPFFEAAADGP